MKKFFAILSLLLATNANAATSISLFGGEPADVSFSLVLVHYYQRILSLELQLIQMIRLQALLSKGHRY